MAEVKKRKILLASVLKPADDTRMAEKIATSLAEKGAFDIHIIGYPISSTSALPFKTYSLPKFNRVSITRLLAPWKVMRQALSLKPDLFIVTTHELLFQGTLVKWLTGCKLVYDIQENYNFNIRYTAAFPKLLRPLLSAYVRLKEKLSSRFVDHFFLAEKSYQTELNFLGTRYTVLENKLKVPSTTSSMQRDKYKLLFSGTLAESTGAFIAIEIAIKLRQIEHKTSLDIVGYAAKPDELERIKKSISNYQFIKLHGGDKPVPHKEILEHIQSAGAGIISYPPNVSTQGSIPTKLYEYLGFSLPIILIDHKEWIKLCSLYNAAIVFNYENINAGSIRDALRSQTFYTTKPVDIFWESEERRLLAVVDQLLN
jgi:glycosyltransferase involved in cell wall biosynthesis